MTLPTGVQARAEAHYGHPDRALDYLQRLTRSFGYALPGGMYEVSPDFGMMVQAWNIYALAQPIVKHFFGVHPHAAQQEILLQPMLPTAWDDCALENLVIGTNRLSVAYTRKEGVETYQISQTEASWVVALELPYREGLRVRIQGDEQDIKPEKGGKTCTLLLKGTNNEVILFE